MGKVAASFEAKEKGISGVVAAGDEETKKIIAENIGILVSSLNESDMEEVDIRVVLATDLSSEQFEMSSLQKENKIEKEKRMEKEEQDETQEENLLQTKRLYHIAESFIQTVSEIL